MNFQGYTDTEINRWLWLRAVEWEAFPAFISQPVAPVLFIFLPWYWVLAGIVGIGLMWCIVRHSFVIPYLSHLACLVVKILKWPLALGSAIYLFAHHQPLPAVVALLWPLVASLTALPGKVGLIQSNLARSIGLLAPEDFDT